MSGPKVVKAVIVPAERRTVADAGGAARRGDTAGAAAVRLVREAR